MLSNKCCLTTVAIIGYARTLLTSTAVLQLAVYFAVTLILPTDTLPFTAIVLRASRSVVFEVSRIHLSPRLSLLRIFQ